MAAPLMNETEKWSTLQNVDSDCWTSAGAGSQGIPIWRLRDDWLKVLFKGAFKSIRAGAGPNLTPLHAIVFVRPDDTYEVRVFSRQRGGEFYDFNWRFGPSAPDQSAASMGSSERRSVPVTLTNGASVSATANAVWMVDPSKTSVPVPPEAKNLRVFCAAIDETIDVNVDSLDLRYQESVREQMMRFVPWQRLLLWMARLRSIDSKAFGRIRKPLKSWLGSRGVDQQIAALPAAAIMDWQRQGLLPPQIALLAPDEVAPLRESIKLQQSLAKRADVLMQFKNVCPIPALLLKVDAAALDPIDLQVFMTIGALRELHGFVEMEQQRLLQRRPDLQAMMQSPQGMRQVQADPEVAALSAHPQAAAEQQDLQDIALRKGGKYGPTTRDMMLAMQIQQKIMGDQLVTNMFLGPTATMLVGLDAADQFLAAALADGPPWKLYRPYLC